MSFSSSFDISPSELAPYAWEYAQVAGLHRADPSTTLDKAVLLLCIIIAITPPMSSKISMKAL